MAQLGHVLVCCICLVILLVGYVNSECSLGWIHYNASCFHFSSDKNTWYTAQTSCHEHRARLAEPKNRVETDFLRNMAHTIRKDVKYWIGARDDIIEGTWQWSSTDKIVTYMPWWPNQPDNAHEEDCLEIWCDSSDCKFNDRPCDYRSYYICEKSYPGVETDVIGK